MAIGHFHMSSRFKKTLGVLAFLVVIIVLFQCPLPRRLKVSTQKPVEIVVYKNDGTENDFNLCDSTPKDNQCEAVRRWIDYNGKVHWWQASYNTYVPSILIRTNGTSLNYVHSIIVYNGSNGAQYIRKTTDVDIAFLQTLSEQ